MALTDLMDNTLFKQFAFYATVCVGKMVMVGFLTTRRRFQKGAFSNPEDVAGEKHKRVDLNDPDVERARRNHRNDLENIPQFILVGLLYTLTNPNPYYALMHFRVFTAARMLHTIAYQLPLPQPARAMSFGVGLITTISMAVQVLMVAQY